VWTPNKRTTVDVGYYDRFYGSGPSLDVTYRRKRNVFTASYSKDLTDARTLRSERGLDDEDPFGNPIDPVADDPPFALNDDGQLVDERYSFSWSRQGKRTTLTWRGDHSTQQPQSSRDEAVFVSSRLQMTRRLTSKLSFDSNVRWEHQEDEDNDEFETWRFSVGLSRPIWSRSNVSLRYIYTDRDSDISDDSYKENLVIMTYTINFLN